MFDKYQRTNYDQEAVNIGLTVTLTEPPVGVNFRALDMRLRMTWSILNLSTYMQSSL